MDLYKKAVSKEEHPEGQGVRIHPDLPIYVNREARIFCYWDHEARMPWQTPRVLRQPKTDPSAGNVPEASSKHVGVIRESVH